MRIRKLLVILFLNSFVLCAQCQWEKTFENIREHNFGLASKQLEKRSRPNKLKEIAFVFFYSEQKEWGLCLKKINEFKINFKDFSVNDKLVLDRYFMDSVRLINLKQEAQWRVLSSILKAPTLAQINLFIEENKDFIKLNEAILVRDELALNQALETGSSSFLRDFIENYPNSSLYEKAKHLYCLKHFDEQTPHKTLHEFKDYIEKNDQSCLMDSVKSLLVEGYIKEKNIQELMRFIEKESNSDLLAKAWTALYNFEIPLFTEEYVLRFMEKYPQYPFKPDLVDQLSLLQTTLYPFYSEQKYGFMDSSGSERLPSLYTEASLFNNALAVVAMDQKYGAINMKGEVIIPFEYDVLYNFESTNTIAGKGDYYGLIDCFNQITIPLKYEEIVRLKENLFAVMSNGAYRIVNEQDELLYQDLFEDVYIDKNKVIVFQNDRYNVLDLAGGYTFNNWFEQINIINDSKIVAFKDNRYSIRNFNDSVFFESQLDNFKVLDASKELFCFLQDDEVVVIDVSGTKLYSQNSEFSALLFQNMCTSNQAYISVKKNKFGVVKDNKTVIPMVFDYINLNDVYAIVQQGANWNIYSLNGQKLEHSSAEAIERINDAYYFIEQNGQKFVYFAQEDRVIGAGYDALKMLGPGILLTEKDNQFGLMNLNGEPIVGLEYTRVSQLDQNLYLLSKGNEVSYYDALIGSIIAYKKD